jgi:hypothetical protein
MPTELEEQLLRENKALRQQIARLLAQKVDLQRQLADVSRERAETGVDAIVAALGRSIRDADAALAAQSEAGPRFTVGDIDATFRGVVVGSTSGVALRLPVPEYGVQPGHLGSIRVSMAVVPPPVGASAPAVPAPTPAPAPAPIPAPTPTSSTSQPPDVRLRESLEGVQATFSNRQGAGKAAADEIIEHTTNLLASPASRTQARTFSTELDGIASGLTRSAKALSRKGSKEANRHRDAAKALEPVSSEVGKAGRVTNTDKERVAAILETLDTRRK